MKQFHSLLILVTLLFCTVSVVLASQMDEALQAFQAGDLPNAIELWSEEATGGDREAQYILGTLYLEGTGVSQSYSETIKWFQASAEQGYALSQNALASMYFFGRGVPKDQTLATSWWLLAAEQGISESQNNLAVAYRDGDGVPQDPQTAIMWFKKAAFQRDVEAMISLGGVYHQEGDSEMAYVWWSIASAGGDETAKKNVEILNSRLTPEEIESAQAIAKKILYRFNE